MAPPAWPTSPIVRAAPGLLWDPLEAVFFQLELAIGVILPMVLLALPAVRRNSGRLHGAALLVVAGFVVNRLNVSITGLEGAQGGRYLPALGEGVLTIMLVAIEVAAFALAVRFLPVMAEVRQPGPVPRKAAALAPAHART
jgi:Ni/Fe-hydrogenase subunit HybB-like protein